MSRHKFVKAMALDYDDADDIYEEDYGEEEAGQGMNDTLCTFLTAFSQTLANAHYKN